MKILGSIIFILISQISIAAQINGAGSTFAEPIYSKWIFEYKKKNVQESINYQGIGSGGGIRQLIAGTVDFAGTDAPLTAQESNSAKFKILHVPIAMGAVVVTYNLNVEKQINLTGQIIGEIFEGKITNWNDPRIQEINKNIKLPDTPIAVVTRSDSSGTTAVFTDYLQKVSKLWEGKASKQVKWFSGSIGAKGNAGIMGLVKQTPGAIGYVELVYALENKMPYAAVKNSAGKFINADNKSVSASAVGNLKEMKSNEFKISITDPKNKDAYPISTFTWLIMPQSLSKEKADSLVGFVRWLITDEAQKIAEGINYSSIPSDLRKDLIGYLDKSVVK